MRGWSSLVLAIVAGIGCAKTGGAGPVAGAGAAEAPGVALVEWQFPTTASAEIRVDPLQKRVVRDDPQLAPAFYPHLSDENATETETGLATLVRHAGQTCRAFAAGRDGFRPPLLLNISAELPAALDAVIDHGVRIVSFSAGSMDRLGGLDAVVSAHPDVLFIAATPHLAGDAITVEAFGERPSVLATRGAPNVILAGCLGYNSTILDDYRPGQPFGTKENPFQVENQPVAPTARQVFMMSCASSRAFGGSGATSSSAPHLASLLEQIVERRVANGLPTAAADVLADLDLVTHRAMAVEETGEIHEVAYFTLDTVLINADRPLVTDQIWWGGFEHPDPVRLP